MRSCIGIFDSGLGGLSILEGLKKTLPLEKFIYYADSLNHPYGEKSKEELIKITSKIVDYLISKGCKIIVIACNTATVICMKVLREKYPDICFVGTVPAIKVACDNNFKNILVMATVNTVKSDRVFELIEDNKQMDQNIYLCPCIHLADSIEAKDSKKIDKLLKKIKDDYSDINFDSIVLGCTHYSFIKKDILKYFPDTVLIDSVEGVSKEVRRQFELNNFIHGEKMEVEFIDSLDNDCLDF